MGFDAWFFGRMDWMDDTMREKNKEFEFIWFPNKDRLPDVNIFTHKMWISYYGPESFDITDNNAPVIVNKTSTSFNAEVWSQKIIKDMENRSKAYLHDEMFI